MGLESPGRSESPDKPPERGNGTPTELGRIRAGDRDAAAQFVLKYEPLIRRRIHGKLGPRMRRVFDTSDILSTVLRRLDLYVSKTEIRATDDKQLLSLIMKVAQAAVIDKGRIIKSLNRIEGPDSELAHLLLSRMERSRSHVESHVDFELDHVFQILQDDLDRQILWLWLSGTDHRAIGLVIGRNPPAVRKRWQTIRQRLHEHLVSETRT